MDGRLKWTKEAALLLLAGVDMLKVDLIAKSVG